MFNTATSGSAARLEIYFKNNGKSFIRIYEYNSNPVSGYSRGTEYRFKFRGDDGSERSFTWNWYEANEIVFGPKNTSVMRSLFSKCSSVKLRVTNLDRTTSSYAFTIACNGFSDAIKKL